MKRFLASLVLLFVPMLAMSQAATRNVVISWNSVTGATGYNLYASSTGTAGPFIKLNSSALTVTTFIDVATIGDTRVYRVSAIGVPCTPTTPVNTPCGESDPAASQTTTTVPQRTQSTTTTTTTVP